MSKNLISFLILIFFSSFLEAKTPPIILEDEKDSYKLGLYLDILEDPTGKLTIKDVSGAHWASKFKRSDKEIPNFGISKSFFWAKFTIKNKTKIKKKWFLTQEYFAQDKITFFTKQQQGWKIITAGDTIGFQGRTIDARAFIFEIYPKDTTTFFLLIHGSVNQFNLKISSSLSYLLKELKDSYFFGLLFGVIIALTFYNSFIYLSTRSKPYLWYIGYSISLGLFLSGWIGFNNWVVFRGVSNYNNNTYLTIFAGFAEVFGLLFTASFLQLKKLRPILYKASRIILVYTLLIPLSPLFLPYIASLKIFVIGMFINFVFYITSGIATFLQGFRPAKFYLLSFATLISGLVINALLISGHLPVNFATINAGLFGNCLELILLSLALGDLFKFQQEQALKKEKDLTEKIEKYNEELEGIVTERTKEAVDAKNKAQESEKNVSNLLNNMKQSVFSINKTGLIIPPVSDHSYEIFGQDIGGKSIFETLLKDIDAKSEVYSQLKFVMGITLGADLFQYEIIHDSLPRELFFLDKDKKKKSLKINYSPILNKDEIVQQLMLVIEDVTELKKLERDAKESEAASAIKIQRLQEIVSQDKKNFRIFSRDVQLNLDLAEKSIQKSNLDGFFRAAHTIKGNARLYNLTGLSGEVHVLESQIIELREEHLDKELIKSRMEKISDEMKNSIENYLKLAREVYGADVDETFLALNTDSIEISKSLFMDSLGQLKNLAKSDHNIKILDIIKKLEFEKFNNSLMGIQQIVQKISASLNKNIQLEISGEEIYLDIKKSSMLKDSIMHIIQNSCDHGIEKEGVIKIELSENNSDISITIADNGRGIDPLAIRKKALEKGIITSEESENFGAEENLGLIMMPGFSTKEVATEYSGRGVGLDVVQTNIRDLGGSIKLNSILGEGTTFYIKVSKS
jgi:signal transduction histidine kinase